MSRFILPQRASDCGLEFESDEIDLSCYYCGEDIYPHENYTGHGLILKCERCNFLADEIKNGITESDDEGDGE